MAAVLNHPLGERLRGVASRDPNRPVMIVGAGEAGAWAINVCKTNKQYGRPVLAVDDDPAKLHQTIHGVPVKGTLEQIPGCASATASTPSWWPSPP